MRIKVEAKDVREPELVRKLETKIEHPIIDDYIVLQSGSGFVIDPDGLIITNHHVATLENEKNSRADLGNALGFYINDELPATLLTPDQKSTLKREMYRLVTTGRLELTVVLDNKTYLPATVVNSDKSKDLALLKVGAENLPCLFLANDHGLKVGAEVFSLGYPLGDVMTDKFKDLTGTFTTGTVSALRPGPQGIQHTATLNSGNSGGPLLNSNGQVAGVNVAMFKNANNLYFAIPVATLRDFLKASVPGGFRNPTIASREGQDPRNADMSPLNSLGEIEVSQDIILKMDPGAVVFLEEVPAATTPAMLHLPNPVNHVRIEGKTGIWQGTLRRLDSIQGSSEPKLPFTPFMGTLEVTSIPPQAEVKIDGKSLGKTPGTFPVPTGPARLILELKGYQFPETEVEGRRDQVSTVSVTGARLQEVKVSHPPTQKAAIVAQKGQESKRFAAAERLLLPPGQWIISVDHPEEYTNGTLELTVEDQPVDLDLLPLKKRGRLDLSSFGPEAKFFLDNQEISGLSAGLAEVPVGLHTLEVFETGFSPQVFEELKVPSEGSAKPTSNRRIAPRIWGSLSLWSGIGLVTSGLTAFSWGAWVGSDQNAVAQSATYADYLNYKKLGADLTSYAAVGIATGVVSLVLSYWFDWEDKKYQATYKNY